MVERESVFVHVLHPDRHSRLSLFSEFGKVFAADGVHVASKKKSAWLSACLCMHVCGSVIHCGAHAGM